jgi:mannitol operon repressor
MNRDKKVDGKIKSEVGNRLLPPPPFTDPNRLDSIHKISAFKKMGIFQLTPALIDDKEIDATLYQLQLNRQQQVIKSSLSLAIVEICNKLNVESPFTT